MAGRIEIDDVAPVVSGGRYPAKAVVGEVVPVHGHGVARRPRRRGGDAGGALPRHGLSAARRGARRAAARAAGADRDGGDAGAAGSSRRHCRWRRVAPRTCSTASSAPTASACGRSGWTAGATRSRRGGKTVTAKLDAGQSESELSNDLHRRRATAGAGRHRRAARAARSRSSTAAEMLRKPGDPFTRAGAALSAEVTELLAQYPLRDLITRGEQYGVWVDRPAGPVQRLVRDVPAVHRRLGQEGQAGPRHVRHRGQGAAPDRQDGLRRGLPAADPPDRQGAPQGPQQLASPRRPRTSARRGRSAATKGGHDAVHPKLGTIEDFDDFVAAARDQRSRGGAGPGAAVRAGPSVGQGASGVVHRAARRHHRLRGEPAEEVPGHLSDQLRQRSGGHLQRGAAGGAVLDQPRRQDLPRRQPAHQAAELLGVADRSGQDDRPRRAVPGRGVHPARPPVRAGQARFHPVLHATSPGAPRSGS